jgi:uncharacterized protein (TIGR03083 family)
LSVAGATVAGVRIDHIKAIAEQSAAFTDAVTRPGVLTRPVTACPGWTVSDLVRHLGEVQASWTLILRAGGARPDEDELRAAHDHGEDLMGWWRERSAGLVHQLSELAPGAPSWCWWNDERRATAADVASRQAHEALVHRWDAEHAAGSVHPTDPTLAADGVDEFATRFLSGGDWSGPSGVLALRAEDTGHEWRFGCGSAAPAGGGRPRWLVDKRALPLATVVTGSAEQLDLMLWRRVEPDPDRIEGDAELLAAFLAWPDLS